MDEAREIVLGICSDTHGGALPLWTGVTLTAVLHAGDVYDAPALIEDDDDPLPRQWAQSLGVPVLAVRGNHDFRDPGRFFETADDLSGRLRRLLPGLWVAGIGFAPERYYDLPGESDLESQCRDISRRARREVMRGETLILLTHYPPKFAELPCGQVPESWTFKCVAELADELQPIAIVQGHVHDWFGRQWRRKDMLIISPGPQARTLCVSHDRGSAGTPSVSVN
jgi:Icc-related predicted phosphoesterase